MGFPAIAAGIGLAGAGISAYNQMSSANAAAKASSGMAQQDMLSSFLAMKAADNAIAAGKNQQISLQRQGDTALASAQASGEEKARLGRLALSNLQANAAFGGGNASSNDVINLAGQIGGQSRYQQLVDLYNGQVQRNAAIDQGNLAMWNAQQEAQGLRNKSLGYISQAYADNARASMIRNNATASAAGTLLGGASSMGLSYLNAKGDPTKDYDAISKMLSLPS